MQTKHNVIVSILGKDGEEIMQDIEEYVKKKYDNVITGLSVGGDYKEWETCIKIETKSKKKRRK